MGHTDKSVDLVIPNRRMKRPWLTPLSAGRRMHAFDRKHAGNQVRRKGSYPDVPIDHFWKVLRYGLAASTAAGCDRGPRADALPLRIAAASDLQRVLPRLIGRFQNQTPTTVTPTLTFDASGQACRTDQGPAPFDLFLSANVKFVTDLAAAGLVEPASVQPYAEVHWSFACTPAGDQVRGLADLSRPEIKRIAIANPDYAPYGLAARQPGYRLHFEFRSSAAVDPRGGCTSAEGLGNGKAAVLDGTA